MTAITNSIIFLEKHLQDHSPSLYKKAKNNFQKKIHKFISDDLYSNHLSDFIPILKERINDNETLLKKESMYLKDNDNCQNKYKRHRDDVINIVNAFEDLFEYVHKKY